MVGVLVGVEVTIERCPTATMRVSEGGEVIDDIEEKLPVLGKTNGLAREGDLQRVPGGLDLLLGRGTRDFLQVLFQHQGLLTLGLGNDQELIDQAATRIGKKEFDAGTLARTVRVRGHFGIADLEI